MQTHHDSFLTKFGIVAAVAGSAVGLGNIWKFPYMVTNNGGGAFIIVYILAVIFMGYPLVCTELAIGRFTHKNTVDAFSAIRNTRFWRMLGYLPLITMLLITPYYLMITGWVLWYLILSCMGQLHHVPNNVEPTAFFDQTFTNLTASLPLSLTITLIAFFFVTVINARGIKSGIEKCSKIMMPILFFILLAMIIYSFTLSGFGQAFSYMFKPDFSAIHPSVIIAAIGQAFLSLSIAMGILITYGIYIKKEQDIRSIARQIIVADTSVAILAGLAIFPGMFTYGVKSDAGPSLIFMTLPQVFLQMPGGRIFSILFFSLVFLAALTSLISLFEGPVTFLQQRFSMNRIKACSISFIGIALLATLVIISQSPDSALVFGTARMTVFTIFDYFTNNITLPITGMLICVLTGFVWKTSSLEQELAYGALKPVSKFERVIFDWIIRWVAAPLIVIVMIAWIYQSAK